MRFGIGGAELAVCLRGDQDKPALLLIHGFPSSSSSFRNVIGTLAQDCFVIAPDLPGFGDSEPISHFADIIDGLLARLGVGPFHLYLHYYGAQASLTRKTR